jgi:tRNA(His) guanylyltransferase
MSNDSLGDRMKNNYENRTRIMLPRRTNMIIRVDGRAFHTYTRNCQKPYDDGLMDDMNSTAIALCEDIQGSKLAYVQSDEISILVTDYDDINTCAWFDGNLQKICSISASIATQTFNNARLMRNALLSFNSAFGHISDGNEKVEQRYVTRLQELINNQCSANFDSRVFIIPETAEVANYFLWRCQDASRNSLQMLARSLYSHNELEGKNSSQLHDLIHTKGDNWNNLAPKYKRGRLIAKTVEKDLVIGQWGVHDIPDTHGFEYWNLLVKSFASV